MSNLMLVLLTKDPTMTGYSRRHEGVNLVVETDPSMSEYVNLFFRNKKTLKNVKRLLEKKEIHFARTSEQSNWLHGHCSTMNVESFLVHLPDYLYEAGYQVLIAQLRDYRVHALSGTTT